MQNINTLVMGNTLQFTVKVKLKDHSKRDFATKCDDKKGANVNKYL